MLRLPSLLGLGVLALVITVGQGRRQGPALLLWLAVGVLVSTPLGERQAVRLPLGSRPLSARQRQCSPVSAIAPTLRAAARGGRLARPDRASPNPCITGRRTVAVTQGA